MKTIRSLIIFIIVSILAFLIFGWYSGFFVTPKIEIKQTGPFVAVVEDYVGEYSETKAIQEKIYDQLWEDGIENFKNFGIYYDDPQNTPISQLRSKVGRVIEKEQESRIRRFGKKYNIFEYKQKQAAVVELPYQNAFSLYAAIYKAYPLLQNFADKNGYIRNNIIEIHDIPDKIIFILPLEKDH